MAKQSIMYWKIKSIDYVTGFAPESSNLMCPRSGLIQYNGSRLSGRDDSNV